MITKLNADWDEYKASRNKVNIALRQAKADYYRNKIATQNNNPKEAWKTINSLLGRSFSDTSVNELKVNDANLTSPCEIAEAFNTYFSNVGPILANSMADYSVSFEQFVKPIQSKMLRFKLRWLHTLFIIGGLVPNLEFSRENVKNICKNKYNFFTLKSEPQVMFILMF